MEVLMSLDVLLVYTFLPIISAYAVYRLGLGLITPWPPSKDALIAAWGGALWWWGEVLYMYGRSIGPDVGEWDLAVMLMGVSLMLLPKLMGLSVKTFNG